MAARALGLAGRVCRRCWRRRRPCRGRIVRRAASGGHASRAGRVGVLEVFSVGVWPRPAQSKFNSGANSCRPNEDACSSEHRLSSFRVHPKGLPLFGAPVGFVRALSHSARLGALCSCVDVDYHHRRHDVARICGGCESSGVPGNKRLPRSKQQRGHGRACAEVLTCTSYRTGAGGVPCAAWWWFDLVVVRGRAAQHWPFLEGGKTPRDRSG